jgi:hypothetical protein
MTFIRSKVSIYRPFCRLIFPFDFPIFDHRQGMVPAGKPRRGQMPATLTDTQKREFVVGYAMWNSGATAARMTDDELFKSEHYIISDVVTTHETFADFVKSHGQPGQSRTTRSGHEIHVWTGVQFRRGQPRGDLFLMEFEGISASLYTGG